jgi:hypothetical protein
MRLESQQVAKLRACFNQELSLAWPGGTRQPRRNLAATVDDAVSHLDRPFQPPWRVRSSRRHLVSNSASPRDLLFRPLHSGGQQSIKAPGKK